MGKNRIKVKSDTIVKIEFKIPKEKFEDFASWLSICPLYLKEWNK